MNKAIITVFFSICFSTSLKARPALIEGNVKGYLTGEQLNFYMPINSRFYNNNIVSFKSVINTSGNFKETINVDNPVFIKITIRGLPIFLFVTPNDSLNIIINLDKVEARASDWLICQGANALGQQYFNNYYFGFNTLKKFKPIYNVYEQNIDNKFIMIKAVQDSISKSLEYFTYLNQQNKISDTFYKNVTLTIKALLYCEALKPFIRPSILSSKQDLETLNKIRESFLLILNPLDTTLLTGVLSSLYTVNYMTFLDMKKRHYKTSSDIQDSTIIIDNKKITIDKFFVHYMYIQSATIKEYLWGNAIINFLQMFPGEELKDDNINVFYYYFPNSTYIPVIKNLIKISLKSDSTNSLSYNTNYILLDTLQKEISIKNFISKYLNGQKVYVDLWATWCQPCLAEFKENLDLDTFLRNNNIKRLYISIDDSSSKKTWAKYINKFILNGYNTIANKELIKDIREKIYSNEKTFSIPRYIIIKDGIILNHNALRPSDGVLLINQLRSYLLGGVPLPAG